MLYQQKQITVIDSINLDFLTDKCQTSIAVAHFQHPVAVTDRVFTWSSKRPALHLLDVCWIV